MPECKKTDGTGDKCTYSEVEKEKMREKIMNPINACTGMNMSLGYALYDVMMQQLNELHQIRKLMESIEKAISLEQKNQ